MREHQQRLMEDENFLNLPNPFKDGMEDMPLSDACLVARYLHWGTYDDIVKVNMALLGLGRGEKLFCLAELHENYPRLQKGKGGWISKLLHDVQPRWKKIYYDEMFKWKRQREGHLDTLSEEPVTFFEERTDSSGSIIWTVKFTHITEEIHRESLHMIRDMLEGIVEEVPESSMTGIRITTDEG